MFYCSTGLHKFGNELHNNYKILRFLDCCSFPKIKNIRCVTYKAYIKCDPNMSVIMTC